MPEAPSTRGGAARWLAEVGDALVSVFLPSGCRLCEKLLVRATRLPICDECLESFPRIGTNICQTCGLPIESAFASNSEDDPALNFDPLCAACRLQAYRFDRARGVFRYEDALVRAIVMLKFEEIDPLADWFANELCKLAAQTGLAEADIVVPVPLHKVRRKERGFNQAESLSKRVAKRLKLPHQGILLVRKRPRPAKHLLTERERWEAVRGAFATRPGSQVDSKRVLLVDDVMTTGATLDACARALREAGATGVSCLTVARAVVRNPHKVGS